MSRLSMTTEHSTSRFSILAQLLLLQALEQVERRYEKSIGYERVIRRAQSSPDAELTVHLLEDSKSRFFENRDL